MTKSVTAGDYNQNCYEGQEKRVARAETYVFYPDLFFLTGLCFNFLALGLAAVLGKYPLRIPRLVAAAAAGSACSCAFAVFPVLPRAGEFAVTVIFVGGAMSAAAFSLKDLCGLARGGGLLFLASSVLGGGFLLFKRSLRLTDGESLLLLTAFAAVCGAFFREAGREHAHGGKRYPVRLYGRGGCRRFSALADSGNRLREPGSGKPVSVVFSEDLKGLAGASPGLLLIPYRSVGTESGMLAAFVADRMEIETETGVRTVERPIVAAAKEPLSKDGDFTMLLPEELLF